MGEHGLGHLQPNLERPRVALGWHTDLCQSVYSLLLATAKTKNKNSQTRERVHRVKSLPPKCEDISSAPYNFSIPRIKQAREGRLTIPEGIQSIVTGKARQ